MRVYLVFLLVLGGGALRAQNNLIFKNINVDNGLPQNTVLSILQDNNGYLWVGTFDGLSRFNGLEFKVYKSDAANPKSIGSNKISKIFTDKAGNIWVGTIDYLNLFDPNTESFTRFKVTQPSGANNAVLSINQDKRGVLWIGTNYGVFYVAPKTAANNTFKLVKLTDGQNDKTTCLYVNNGDEIWMGAAQTLRIYSLQKKQFVSLPAVLQGNKTLLHSTIRNIIQDSENNYWIATETDGLFYYNVKTGACFNYNQGNGLLSNTVRAVLEKSPNVFWIGTKKGLNIINTQTGRIDKFTYDPLNANSLSQNSIRCLYKDNEGNIWIGTFSGGLNAVYSQFDNFYSLGLRRAGANGLSYRMVNAVFAGNRGDLWVGTDDGGLNHLDSLLQNTHVYYQYNGANKELLGNSIKGIAAHADTNKLWLTTGNGLKIFDKLSGTITPAPLIPQPNDPGFIQTCIFLNDEHGLWIGSNYSGLYYLEKNGKLHHYPTSKNSITALYKDGNEVWIGLKDHGLDHLDLKTNTVKAVRANPNNAFSLSDNPVLAIYRDSRQRLWIGTDGGGLTYFDVKTGRFYSITEAAGIANNTIHAILEDGQGRLWISTNKGLSCIAFKQFNPPFQKKDIAVSNYTVTDGLQSNQFSNGAALRTAGGKFVFAGINGITVFRPENIHVNPVKPRVVFTAFSIFDKPVEFGTPGSPLQKTIDETTEIKLSYNQAFFTIRFAALNFINPEKNRFAYKLEGFADDDWHYADHENTATYTNLNPGEYIFKIKAANNDGVWNDVPRQLKIIISPPWWKTYYAYTGYLTLIIFLLYLFNLYSKRTERLKNELEFESMSHAKDQELAQKQLSFFVNMSHEIKTPLTMIMAPLEDMVNTKTGDKKVHEQLKLMQRNGKRLTRLINELLDKKKLESGQMHLQAAEANIVLFVNEITLALKSLAELKNINLKLNAPETALLVWFDADKLEKVLYNLLSNAVKFTPHGGDIIVSITKDGPNNLVLISVEDSGCGIKPENLDKIFNQFYHFAENVKIEGTGLGLAFSKELVELHHGQLSVESIAGTADKPGYTCFTISLPLGSHYLKPGEIAPAASDENNIVRYTDAERPQLSPFAEKKEEILKLAGRDKLIMLIAEDNEDVRNYLKKGFENDFDVYAYGNGTDALAHVKEVNPDAMISDVMMPGINGMELCNRLKTDIDTSHIPLILLTARSQAIFKVEGLESGADDYITKPFNFSVIEARVWNLIESRHKLRMRYQKEIKLDPQNITINNLDEAFLTRVLKYVEDHIADPDLSVEQLSQEMAMSKSAFYKKIKSLTDQTGVEFIRTIRVKRAAQLLTQGQLTVNQVAYEVGFMDVDYFRKCFKEHFNYTPKEHPLHGSTETI